MSRWESWRELVSALALAFAGIGVLVFLYLYNPQDIAGFPRCPFYALTGYKCPGCGTLRAIHSALHLRFGDAWRFNPILFAAVPAMLALVFSRKFAASPAVGWTILAVTALYWILRNVVGF